jgi:hypothetical protein
MPTWGILLLILALLLVVGTMYSRYRKKKIAAAAANGGTGVQLRKMAEQIPVYGQFVKVAGVVGKPLNSGLDKLTQYQINALHHIPVVGGVVAKPLEYGKQFASKVNNWIGL